MKSIESDECGDNLEWLGIDSPEYIKDKIGGFQPEEQELKS